MAAPVDIDAAGQGAPGSSAPGVRVGLISDTHGWLDPRVVAAFAHEAPLAAIVHAGDIGSAAVLWELEAIAPVTAVLGNCDSDVPGWQLDLLARATVGGVRILAIHDFSDLGPIPADVDVIVRGHSHVSSVQWFGSTLVINPGSATQRRSQPGCTVGVLDVASDGGSAEARIVPLDKFGDRVR